jgi:4-carboxymuconolactone decarboxylase
MANGVSIYCKPGADKLPIRQEEGMSEDYEKGYRQFSKMVGEENMEKLLSRFRSVCPDFEREVVSVLGGRIWSRGGIDLRTRSLCSICVLAALGRNNALKLNLQMALNNGVQVEEIFEAMFQVAAYAGFAAAWDALDKLAEVLKDREAC